VTASRTGGAAVVRALAAHGVDLVFGIPGTHSLELYRYLPEAGIRHVVTRHEQGAGYAADGWARVTGRPGVVLTTSGPGVTNAVTAAATAYADSVPLLLVSPGAPRGLERADVGRLHEVKDQSAALDAVCAWSRRVSSADEAAEAVAEAFAFFASSRPRPVHVEVPGDVLDGAWDGGDVPVASPPPRPGPDAAALARASEVLRAASRPAMVVGGGAVDAAVEARAVAEAYDLPVVTTVNGKGVVPESHPLSCGASVRLPAAQALLQAADALLVVGSELGDSDLWEGTVQPSGPVVRVDLDAAQLDKNLAADVRLHADAALALRALVDALGADAPGDAVGARGGAERAAGARRGITSEVEAEGAPWRAVHDALASVLPPDGVVAGDSSRVSYLGTVHQLPLDGPRRFVYPPGYATLGYGLPAAVGAALAGRPTVGVVGDGAFAFSMAELLTAAQEGVALPVVVVNDEGYGEIRGQMEARGITPLGVDLLTPDLPALARACRCHGVRIGDVAELPDAVALAWTADRPTLLEVRAG
jgi:thiamine pyrophosphate-dependent acetolactate synthase large subunit-like protein